jgi:hypothetical protein
MELSLKRVETFPRSGWLSCHGPVRNRLFYSCCCSMLQSVAFDLSMHQALEGAIYRDFMKTTFRMSVTCDRHMVQVETLPSASFLNLNKCTGIIGTFVIEFDHLLYN